VPTLVVGSMPALASTGAMICQLLVSTIPVLNVCTGPALKVSTEYRYHPRHMPVLVPTLAASSGPA